MVFIKSCLSIVCILTLGLIDCQPVKAKGSFKVALSKPAVMTNAATNNAVSFIKKQKQTAYNHGSGM
jgi:hypothetical protein